MKVTRRGFFKIAGATAGASLLSTEARAAEAQHRAHRPRFRQEEMRAGESADRMRGAVAVEVGRGAGAEQERQAVDEGDGKEKGKEKRSRKADKQEETGE